MVPDTSEYPYWIEMMQDYSVNFYDVQHAFNTYMKGRDLNRTKGWKPYKRWEYRMLQGRISADGTRLPQDHVMSAYRDYLTDHDGARSMAGDWMNLGPFTVPEGRGYKGLGRLNAIAFDPADPNIIWVGSPAGGLWKTTTGGNSWTSSTQDLPSLGVSAILIDPSNPQVMYIGTGDRDAGDAYGVGVYRSTDGGETWQEHSNGMGNRTVGRMIMHPTNSLVILAATNNGVYRTNDGGANWSRVQAGDFKDIVFKPNDPTVVYAAGGGSFFRSTNTGQTFTQVTSGLPSGARAAIAVTPANPAYVYVILTNFDSFQGLYRSTDSGQSFTVRSTSPNIMSWGCNGGDGGQAWYDLDIAADPNNSDIIFAGGVNCFKSASGGTTWNISSHWWGDCGVPAVHADLHVLEYNPLNDRLYAGNDGGIYFTENQGASWTLITNGLPISQVYKIGQSATQRNKTVNGYQDNGTSTYMGSSWQFILGGDGMECAVDPVDANYSYATIYYGYIARFYQNSNNGTVAENGFNGINESGAWVTPFILDENNPNIMFVGYKNVWRSTNIKSPSSQIVWQKISNGLAGSNSNDMRVLEQSPANSSILYAVRYDDKLFRTDDAMGQTPVWYNLTDLMPASGGILDVECHPFNPDIVYISQDNKIFKSTDRGLSWEDISGTLPSVGYTSIACYKNAHEGLYISSDLGVFYRDAHLDDWIMFSNGLPADASVNEVEIYYDPTDPSLDVIRAGTYGRGLWSSDMYHSEPDAAFEASETVIPTGCAIDFRDLSSGVPTSWYWEFTGATPAVSFDRNPSGILYETTGTYPVKLFITNEAGEDSLLAVDYITVSDTLMPMVDFSASATNVCTNGIVHFTDNSLYCPSTWEWSFSPTTIAYKEETTANSQNPIVEFRQPGIYTVTLTVTNSNGQNTLTRTDYVQAGGYALPYEEDFEYGTLSDRNWSVINPDFNSTWDRYLIPERSNHSVQMKFYGYFKMGERDYLVSPYMNFSQFSNVYLTFDHAYAQRFSQKDSLIISISSGCEENWVRVWANGPDGNGGFETSPATPYEFIPVNNDDWCSLGWGSECFTIDLSDWAGDHNVKLRFEAYNQMGNNLYIDNITVSNTTSSNAILPAAGDFTVYPNPGNGLFTLDLSQISGDIQLSIVNAQGRSVRAINLQGGKPVAIDLRELASGVYLLKLVHEGNSRLRKLIIE